MRKPRVKGLALLALLVGCGSPPAPARHLVLITVDTLRADHLGCYGNDAGLPPNLDRLAQESALFARAYAPVPLTVPSLRGSAAWVRSPSTSTGRRGATSATTARDTRPRWSWWTGRWGVWSRRS